MLNTIFTGQFRKDYKSCKKRNYNMLLLQSVIDTLAIPEQLEAKYRTHTLSGCYADKKECHILPDWLLIYKVENDNLVLYRTGTHSDLFS